MAPAADVPAAQDTAAVLRSAEIGRLAWRVSPFARPLVTVLVAFGVPRLVSVATGAKHPRAALIDAVQGEVIRGFARDRLEATLRFTPEGA